MMGNLQFVRDKNGQVIGSKKTDQSTSITTIYDQHGNVLGRGYATRQIPRGKDGNVVRWDGDPSFLLK